MNMDRFMELFGNNLSGALSGASNKSMEDAIKRASENPEDKKAYENVYNSILIRLQQGAHIVVPGVYAGTEKEWFVYGTCRNSEGNSEWFVGYTSHGLRDCRAGKDWLQIPLEAFLRQTAKTENISGIILNPIEGTGWLLPQKVIRSLLTKVENYRNGKETQK